MTDAPRPALSRERIASTALELIDANGLSGLSMRKLGAELGVEAMSLYHYVKNKDDLLDAVADHLYGVIDLPMSVDPLDWEQAIRLGLGAFHDVLLEHDAALELFASRQVRSARSMGVLHWAHERFVAVGLSLEEAHKALHMAVSFVMGHAASETGGEMQAVTPDDANPEMAAYFAHVETVTPEQQFEAGVDIVVAGLRQFYDLP